MSKIKKSFEEFKEDPKEWRKQSWDAIDEKKIKPYNFLIKGLYLISGLMFLLLSLVSWMYLPISIILLMVFYKYDTRKMKNKYGSKEE